MNISLKHIDTLDKKIFLSIICISVLSSLRALFVPLAFDEITYLKLSNNILSGQYFIKNSPSSIAPAIPFLFAIFKVKSYPLLGFILHKVFNIMLAILGGRYFYLFVKKQQLKQTVILALLALIAVNPNSVAWFSSLYPEALLFFSLWGFIFYVTEPISKIVLIKTLTFFVLMVFTRYVYAILGIIILYKYYDYLRNNFSKYGIMIIKYSLLFAIPVLLWGKFILNIENQNLSEISYFDRFKTESPILYNIKCGLGLEKHYEVDKINGIPAFATLFVPKTGFRNYGFSLLLIFGFIYGLLTQRLMLNVRVLFLTTLLIMLGLIIAGTGFSRYWLVLLPSFCLGYYYLFQKLGLKDLYFVRFSQLIALIYIVNEIRLDIMILNKI